MDQPDERTLRSLCFDETAGWLAGIDLDTPLGELSPEVREMLRAVWDVDQEPTVPAGPWAWQRVMPDASRGSGGEALVGADGRWVVWGEQGYGVLDFANSAVKELLAAAWQLEDAKRIGRLAWQHTPLEWRRSLGDVSQWPWLEDDA